MRPPVQFGGSERRQDLLGELLRAGLVWMARRCAVTLLSFQNLNLAERHIARARHTTHLGRRSASWMYREAAYSTLLGTSTAARLSGASRGRWARRGRQDQTGSQRQPSLSSHLIVSPSPASPVTP